MENNYTVYMHRFPNGKVYIGITCQKPKDRWRNGEGYKKQTVYRAIEKYGWENIYHAILCSELSKIEAEKMEIELIAKFNSNCPEYGYNIENGGNCIGTHSEATKQKIANSNRIRKISPETGKRISKALKGRKIPEERKQRISQTLKGRKFSEETLRKMSNASKGHICSQETREKLRQAKLGVAMAFSNPEERGEKISAAMAQRNIEHPEIMEKMREEAAKKCSKKVVQKDLNGNFIALWQSAAEIERVIGINHVQISRHCRNQGKPLCGFLWEFYDK